MSNVGRNDPCPCGSGKKYKKCCLPRDDLAQVAQAQSRLHEPAQPPAAARLAPDLEDEIERLMEALDSGRGKRVKAEIEALYARQPDHHLTNFAMGVNEGNGSGRSARRHPLF
jgi:SEC-C motif